MIGYKKYNEPVWKCPFNANSLLDYDYNSLDAEMMDGWVWVNEWVCFWKDIEISRKFLSI